MEITLENVLEIIAGIALIAAWIELGKCRSEIYKAESRSWRANEPLMKLRANYIP